jgi:ABC-2 type transport system ATP-binding protein
MIRADDLTKQFGNRCAVDGLSFEAQQGDILGFLGPNGAGKTTTMRMLTGFLPPTAGSAIVAGYDIQKESIEVRKRVGYLPETVPLYSEMSSYEYLDFFAHLRHLQKIDYAITNVLEMVGLADRASGLIRNLSKGMRQRLGLAQALLHKPEVLILDEPTIGLDPAQIIEFRNLIREISRDRTILLSTHILSEAQQLCNRILIIKKGKIVVEDTPDNLQARIKGSPRVQIRVRGDASQLIQEISLVPGIHDIKQFSTEGLFEIEYANGMDLRPQIARMAIIGNYDLLEIRPVNAGLEDVFLELTREDTSNDKE